MRELIIRSAGNLFLKEDKMIRTNDFRINELDGGLNLYNSPNEIQNKQWVKVENYNFSWNKLISSSSYVENSTSTGKIWAITVSWDDIWHISEWKLYKNNTEQVEAWWVFIDAKVLTSYWEQFRAYLRYYITIDWIEYTCSWLTWEAMIADLKLQLINTNNYNINSYSLWFFLSRKDLTAISVTANKKTVLLSTIITNPNSVWWGANPKFEQFEINWKHYIVSYPTNVNDTNKVISYNIYNSISSTLSAFNNSVLYLKNISSSGITVLNLSDVINYDAVWIIVNGVTSWSMPTPAKEDFLWWRTAITSATLTIDWIPYNWTWIDTQATLISLRDNIRINTFLSADVYFQDYTTNWDRYWIIVWNNTTWAWKSIYSNFVTSPWIKEWLVSVRIWTSTMNWNNQWYECLNQFNKKILSASSPLNWVCNISVGNSWALITDFDNWWATYYVDWIKIPIWEDKVWKPKLWTIYRWKIILWWYSWNDNIVHSVSWTIDNPFNIFDFSNYNSWGGSISWWSKSEVTWFSVSENWLYVFKQDEVWYSNNERDTWDTFEFIFRKITNNWALSQSTITNIWQDVFYLDWKNRAIRRLSYEQNLTTLRDTAISNEVQTLLKSLPEQQSLACSHYKYPLYKIHLSDWTWWTITYSSWNTYNKNNICLTYNVDNKSWAVETSYPNVTRADKWFFSKSDDKIYKDQIGKNNNWSFISKEFDFWDATTTKRFREVEIYWVKDNSVSWTIKVIVDWELFEQFDIESNFSWWQFRNRFMTGMEGRSISIWIDYTWAWKFEINEVSIKYIPVIAYY